MEGEGQSRVCAEATGADRKAVGRGTHRFRRGGGVQCDRVGLKCLWDVLVEVSRRQPGLRRI